MKLFLSWSGERSRMMAAAFKPWISEVIQVVEPWMSEDDIQKGAGWFNTIRQAASDTDFGVFFLTPENITSPWLLFEAGCIGKNYNDSRVYTFLLGLSPSGVSQPLSNFQNTRADRTDVFKLVKALNDHIPKPRAESALAQTFDKYWPDLEKNINLALNAARTTTAPPKRSDKDMLQELVESSREIMRVLDEVNNSFVLQAIRPRHSQSDVAYNAGLPITPDVQTGALIDESVYSAAIVKAFKRAFERQKIDDRLNQTPDATNNDPFY